MKTIDLIILVKSDYLKVLDLLSEMLNSESLSFHEDCIQKILNLLENVLDAKPLLGDTNEND